MFTERAPFPDLTNADVISEVGVHDRRPSRPPEPASSKGLSDDVWSFMQECWAVQPGDRPPNMKDAFRKMLNIVQPKQNPWKILEQN